MISDISDNKNKHRNSNRKIIRMPSLQTKQNKLTFIVAILFIALFSFLGVKLLSGSHAASLNNPYNTEIGLNEASKLGGTTSATIYKSGITWTRINPGDYSPPSSCASGSGCTWYPAVQVATSENFNIDLIVGNTSDTSHLDTVNIPSWTASTLSEIQNYHSNPNVKLFEVQNESYLKGGCPSNGAGSCTPNYKAEPAIYGKMFLSLYNAVKNAGLADTVKLLFNSYGNYSTSGSGFPACYTGSANCSSDDSGGGWLRDAVNANPGLGAAIAANAIAIHPYGPVQSASTGKNTYGTGSITEEEGVAQQVLGTIPGFYLTEIGFGIGAGNPVVPDQNTQASALSADFGAYLSDSHVKGVWVYTINDDGTGHFGVFNGPDSPRPAFTNVLANISSGGVVGDKIPPNVGMVTPTNGSTLSGTATLSANASDNVAVANVQFKVDGNNVGTAIPNAPYTTALDTTKLTNGSHTITTTATDTSNNSASASVNVTINNSTAKDTTPPSVPTGLTSPTSSSSVISLTWNTSTDTGSSGMTGYKVYRNGNLAGTTSNASYNDTGLSSSTSYTYTIAAYDNAGNVSAQSSGYNAKTTAATTGSSVQNFNWNTSNKTLTWAAYPGVNKYEIATVYISPAQNTTYLYPWVAGTSTSYTPPALSNKTVYYSILPVDANGASLTGPNWTHSQNVSWSSQSDTTPPTTPSGLSAKAISGSQINLNWAASTDNIGVTGYKIYRSSTSSTSPVQIGTSSSNSFGVTGLSPNTSYTFYVAAYDATGNLSPKSASVSATTQSITNLVTVEGVITNAWTNKPIAGVNIIYTAVTGRAYAKTDANGFYRISNISPYPVKHSYYVIASGYKNQYYYVSLPAGLSIENLRMVP